MENLERVLGACPAEREVGLPLLAVVLPAQVLRLARHMVFWGDGRVIDALCGTNRYLVSEK